jgi:hypothetical protein
MKIKKYFVLAIFVLILLLVGLNIKEGYTDISGNCYKTKMGTGLKIYNANKIRDVLQNFDYDTDSTDKLTLLQDIGITKTEDTNVYQLIHNSNKSPDERIRILKDITNSYDLCNSA